MNEYKIKKETRKVFAVYKDGELLSDHDEKQEAINRVNHLKQREELKLRMGDDVLVYAKAVKTMWGFGTWEDRKEVEKRVDENLYDENSVKIRVVSEVEETEAGVWAFFGYFSGGIALQEKLGSQRRLFLKDVKKVL